MIWLTWRQFRTQAWTMGALLVALAVALAATAPQLRHLYDDSGLPGCTGAACDQAAQTFLQGAHSGLLGQLASLGTFVLFGLPPIIGVFWGAPMVARELETGTFRLAWNQSVTRNRWLLVKLVGLGVASMAAAGLASLLVSWWSAPIVSAGHDALSSATYASHGVVPVGYAAFAYTVGVVVGLVSRRTVLAMGVTLAVVIVAMVAMPLGLRAQLVTPVHLVRPLGADDFHHISMSGGSTDIHAYGDVDVAGAWVLSNRTITSDGKEFTGPADTTVCGIHAASPGGCMQWLAAKGLRQDAWYVPASRFWTLQWREAGLFLALAALLGASCFWWVRRQA